MKIEFPKNVKLDQVKKLVEELGYRMIAKMDGTIALVPRKQERDEHEHSAIG